MRLLLLLLASLLLACPGTQATDDDDATVSDDDDSGDDDDSSIGDDDDATGDDDDATKSCNDVDQDGVCLEEGDCDDNDPDLFPGNTEDCTDGDDQDCDALADCADSDCAAATVCQTEDCENGVDDNDDTLVDCDDPDCTAVTICMTDFTVTLVDDAGDVGKNCAIALSSTDVPHLSYMEDDGDGDLKYATRPATTWATETVDDGIFAGTSSSIQIGSDDHPRIAYDQFGAAWYGVWDGANWTLTEASPFGGEDVSLALSFDEPSILHHDGDLLMLVAQTGTTWGSNDNITGSATASTEHFGELRFDPDFIPHIGFVNTNFYRARYGWNDTTGWQFEDVSTLDIIGGVSFALEPFGPPHMVYGTLLTDEIRYAVRTGTNAWTQQTIASNTGAFKELSMQLDSAGNPHVAWSSAGTAQVHYTWFDGATWTTQAIDDVGSQGGNPCLALDAADNPHLGYYDADTGSLKFASWIP